MRALFTEATRFQSWLDVEAALAELTIIPAEMPDSSIHGMRIGPMFSPIVHFRFGATAGYTGSRGTGEVRPRGRPCCHRLQSADSSHSGHSEQTAGLTKSGQDARNHPV